MIIPSIDLSKGRAVQLRSGEKLLVDGGDPFAWAERFAPVGEIAVIDLDAARGEGDNSDLIRRLVRRYRCRVGGGIRTAEAARAWLAAGARRVILGTAASPGLCGALPRERVIAAVDARDGVEVVEGWRSSTGRTVLDRVRELAPTVGGFLLTQVEREGGLGGLDPGPVRAAQEAAPEARMIAAGGIRDAEEIGALDRLGADAQVGAALYTGRFDVGDAFAACVRAEAEPWATVVCDEEGRALGLAWSTRETLTEAIRGRRGVYWSRSRQEIWRKGETSGNRQALLRVGLDCDRDAIRFVVRQTGAGFCHEDTWTCWGDDFGLGNLLRLLERRRTDSEPGSGTRRLLEDADLLRAKLAEEASELAAARGTAEAVHETADVLYFALVALAREGGTLGDVLAELERRHLTPVRRPMRAKEAQP